MIDSSPQAPRRVSRIPHRWGIHIEDSRKRWEVEFDRCDVSGNSGLEPATPRSEQGPVYSASYGLPQVATSYEVQTRFPELRFPRISASFLAEPAIFYAAQVAEQLQPRKISPRILPSCYSCLTRYFCLSGTTVKMDTQEGYRDRHMSPQGHSDGGVPAIGPEDSHCQATEDNMRSGQIPFPEDEVEQFFREFGTRVKGKLLTHPLESITALATVLLAIAGTYALWIYGGQLSAEKMAANAATNAANAATDSMKLDERAWVTMSDIKLNLSPDGINVTVYFANSGKTPARLFTIQILGESVREGQRPKGRELKLPGVGLIAPNGTFHTVLTSNSSLISKGSQLVVHGRVAYSDIFSAQHWTSFCYNWIPNPNGFVPCNFGNDTDDSVSDERER